MHKRLLAPAAIVFGGLLAFVGSAEAQTYIYPDRGQSSEQEEKDKLACHQWAQQQTGVDPSQPAQVYNPPQQQQGFGAFGGAARGAAAGAIGGAIGGNAGKGAAIGAAVGGFLGVLRRRHETEEQNAAQQQQIQAHDYALKQYDRAFSTCLSGKGYTVSH